MGAYFGAISTLATRKVPTNGLLVFPFPNNGVVLSHANDYFTSCGGSSQLEGLTTTEVNERFMKPMTSPFFSVIFFATC